MRGLGCVAMALVLAGCLTAGPNEDNGQTVEAPRAPGPSGTSSASVRPGVGIGVPSFGFTVLSIAQQGAGCTGNVLLRSAWNGTTYMATAAHCVSDRQPGDRVGVALDGNHVLHWARIAYVSMWEDPSADPASCTGEAPPMEDSRRCFNDFALLELEPATLAHANATVVHWAGPVREVGAPAAGGRVVTVGATPARDDTPLPSARDGVVLAVGHWSMVVQFSTTTPAGDSGSPVLDGEGRAVGVVIARTPNFVQDPLVGTTYVARLDAVLEAAAQAGWTGLEVLPGEPFRALPLRSAPHHG